MLSRMRKSCQRLGISAVSLNREKWKNIGLPHRYGQILFSRCCSSIDTTQGKGTLSETVTVKSCQPVGIWRWLWWRWWGGGQRTGGKHFVHQLECCKLAVSTPQSTTCVASMQCNASSALWRSARQPSWQEIQAVLAANSINSTDMFHHYVTDRPI